MPQRPVVQSGCYGKLPQRGDFVKSRLPASFVTPWDQWLQALLSRAPSDLGRDWLEYYLTLPIYRFALSPGCAGEYGWMGLLMPSVDMLGRQFPFTLACPLVPNQSPLTAFESQTGWFSAGDQWLQSVLAREHRVLPEFSTELPPLDEHISQASAKPPLQVQSSTTANPSQLLLQLPFGEIGNSQQLSELLLPHVLQQTCAAYSMWWSHGSEDIEAPLLLCQGLPDARQATALLDGQWHQRGWLTLMASK